MKRLRSIIILLGLILIKAQPAQAMSDSEGMPDQPNRLALVGLALGAQLVQKTPALARAIPLRATKVGALALAGAAASCAFQPRADITIRDYNTHDREFFVETAKDAFLRTPAAKVYDSEKQVEWSTSRWLDYYELEADQNSCIKIVVYKGTPAGGLFYQIETAEDSTSETGSIIIGEIYSLGIKKEFRELGLANALGKKAYMDLFLAGTDEIRIRVGKGNTVAKNWYERLGFKTDEDEELSGDSSIPMVLLLRPTTPVGKMLYYPYYL